MAYVINNKTHQGSQLVQLIYVLRDAQNKAEDISGLIANLTQGQLDTYVDVKGTNGLPVNVAAVQTLLVNAVAALNDPAIIALTTQVVF